MKTHTIYKKIAKKHAELSILFEKLRERWEIPQKKEKKPFRKPVKRGPGRPRSKTITSKG